MQNEPGILNHKIVQIPQPSTTKYQNSKEKTVARPKMWQAVKENIQVHGF